MANRKALEKQYRKLARQANKQMRELEQAAAEGHDDYLRYAYARAQRDVRQWGGRTRFGVKPDDLPANTKQLQAKIADVKAFIEHPTSSVAGIEDVYQSRVDTINEQFDTDFDLDSMQAFFDLGYGDKLKDQYGSRQAFDIVRVIEENMDKLVKQIKGHRKRELHLDGESDVLMEKVNEVISSRKYGSKMINVLMK